MRQPTLFRDSAGYALLVVTAALTAVGVFGISMYIASRANYMAARNLAKKAKTHLEAAGVITAVAQDLKNGNDGDSLEAVEGAYSLSNAGSCPADDSALVHWLFDEGTGSVAGDSSGNGHDGAISGATWDSAGFCGQGVLFDGSTGDNVVDEDGELYINGLDRITICLWVKSNITNTDKGVVYGQNAGGGDASIQIRYDASGYYGGGDDVIKLVLTTTNGETQYESASNVQTTDWQHLAMIWTSGEEIQLYIDGNLDSPTEPSSAVSGTITSVEKLLVGQAGKDGSSSGWDGMIDDFRIYGRALTQGEIATVMGGGSLGSDGGTLGATLSWGLAGGDTVDYVVRAVEGGYLIAAEGATAGDRYGSSLDRTIVFTDTIPGTSPSTYYPFSDAFTVHKDLYFGRFEHEWCAGPPVFVGNIRSSGEIYIDRPYSGVTGDNYPVHFGYDLDGDNTLEVNGDQGNELCKLTSQSGQLYTFGGNNSIDDAHEIFVNKKPDASGISSYINYAVYEQSENDDYYVAAYDAEQDYFKLTDLNENGTIDTADFQQYMRNSLSLSIKDSAVNGGVYIDARDGDVVFDDVTDDRWFFDWCVRKKVRLWDIDMEALKARIDAMASFNGYVYIERDLSSFADDEFPGVRFLNFETSPFTTYTGSSGGEIRGLTIATPHHIYTKGEVNTTEPSVHLCLIGYAYTALSNSWEDALCRWSSGDVFDRLMRLSLHNQEELYIKELCHRGNCVDNWGVHYPVDDSVSNWFFIDKNGALFRREPRNDPDGASDENDWNHGLDPAHPDNTVVKAVIVTGYSLPRDHDTPTSTTVDCGSYNKNLVNTANSSPYDADKARFSDGISFLEAWEGRGMKGSGRTWEGAWYPYHHWHHEFHLYGSLNLLWECVTDRHVTWGTTKEGGNGLTLTEPLHDGTDWLEETCTGGDANRQVKIGTSSNPQTRFHYVAFEPPGFAPLVHPGSAPTEVGGEKVGSWRRDYGVID